MPDTATRDTTLRRFMETVGSDAPTPGGGAVAGVVGALAASLGQMVVAFTRGRKKWAEHDALHAQAATALGDAAASALHLAEADAVAYGALNALWRLPEDDPVRVEQWHDAVEGAIDVPRQLLHLALDILRTLDGLTGKSNRMLRSDLGMAAVLAEATARSAAWNIGINLPLLTEQGLAASRRTEVEEQVLAARALARQVEDACR